MKSRSGATGAWLEENGDRGQRDGQEALELHEPREWIVNGRSPKQSKEERSRPKQCG